jgi:hypothetical protein
MTREEIEKRMDALAREYAKTQDREIARQSIDGPPASVWPCF